LSPISRSGLIKCRSLLAISFLVSFPIDRNETHPVRFYRKGTWLIEIVASEFWPFVMLVCFVGLFLQLNNLQVREAPSLRQPRQSSSESVGDLVPESEGPNSWLVMAPFSPSPSTWQGYERHYPDGRSTPPSRATTMPRRRTQRVSTTSMTATSPSASLLARSPRLLAQQGHRLTQS